MISQPIKPQKNQNSSCGRKYNCINFQMCPLCYGCRRYNSTDPICQICIGDKKTNICNKELHRDEVTASMITKNNIKLENISFISSKGENQNDK